MFKLGKDYGLEELKDMIYNLRKQEEKKSRAWIWITAAAVLALVGGIVFVWYKFLREDDFYDEFDEFDYDEYEDEDYEDDYEDDYSNDRDYGIVYEEEDQVVAEPEDETNNEETKTDQPQ